MFPCVCMYVYIYIYTYILYTIYIYYILKLMFMNKRAYNIHMKNLNIVHKGVVSQCVCELCRRDPNSF